MKHHRTIAQAQEKILKDPNSYGSTVLLWRSSFVSKKKMQEAKKQISQIYEGRKQLQKHLITEILNLNAFGKCCANSRCKADVFDLPGAPVPMKYEKPSENGVRQ